jgi:phospholipid-binding lipoprotein MlaA
VKAKRPGCGAACALLLLGSACSTANGPDPGRGYNEPVFHFNDGLDRWVLGPVARGWDWLMPGFVLTGVDNFFRNLDVPRTFVNDLLQAKPLPAVNDVGRFVVNTTVGIVASWTSPRGSDPGEPEDFGQTRLLSIAGAFMLLPWCRIAAPCATGWPTRSIWRWIRRRGRIPVPVRVRHRRGRCRQPARHQ